MGLDLGRGTTRSVVTIRSVFSEGNRNADQDYTKWQSATKFRLKAGEEAWQEKATGGENAKHSDKKWNGRQRETKSKNSERDSMPQKTSCEETLGDHQVLRERSLTRRGS